MKSSEKLRSERNKRVIIIWSVLFLRHKTSSLFAADTFLINFFLGFTFCLVCAKSSIIFLVNYNRILRVSEQPGDPPQLNYFLTKFQNNFSLAKSFLLSNYFKFETLEAPPHSFGTGTIHTSVSKNTKTFPISQINFCRPRKKSPLFFPPGY